MITFDGVSKRYPDGTVAVDELSLVAPSGQITVLVGPSGCGKTTSLRMVNRMIEPTSGTITIDDRDVTSVPATELRRGIGYVIQHAGLFPHRTVGDNVATVPQLTGTSRRKARARALELLERVGLPASFADRYPARGGTGGRPPPAPRRQAGGGRGPGPRSCGRAAAAPPRSPAPTPPGPPGGSSGGWRGPGRPPPARRSC